MTADRIDPPSRAERRVSGDKVVVVRNPCEVTACIVCDTERVLPATCRCEPYRMFDIG